MYISGVPGIGKTACLNEVLSKFEKQSNDLKIVKVNGMELK